MNRTKKIMGVAVAVISAYASAIAAQDSSPHWAFRKLTPADIPDVQATNRALTPIDAFVLAKLEAKDLSFAADADRPTLIRRLYLDLLGLPPTIDEVDEFQNDVRPDAWERLVDRALASPRFGERWARHWLDVVGYADTVGFDMNPDGIVVAEGKWRYRDYVIDSFNADKPYDLFIRQQLAGDEAVDWRRARKFTPRIVEHLVATGFLRTAQDFTLEPISDIPSNHYAVIHDTLEVLGASLFAVTLKCARCHDHKYDPISQEDYYRLMACLTPAYNSKNWKAVTSYRPDVVDRSLPDVSASEQQEIKRHNESIDREVAKLKERTEAIRKERLKKGLDVWHLIGPFQAAASEKVFDKVFLPEQEVELKKSYEGGELSWQKRAQWKDGAVHELEGGANAANYVYRTIEADADGRAEFSLGSDDGIKLWVNGKLVLSKDVRRGAAPDQERVKVSLRKGTNRLLAKISNVEGGHAFYFRIVSVDGLSLGTEAAEFESRIRNLESRRRSSGKIQALWDVGPPPSTHLHIRGNFERPGDEVPPGFLRVLSQRDDGRLATKQTNHPSTSGRRTALAHCVTRRDTPASALLARVMVNRVWMHLFGEGLVFSAGNFGIQGTPPTHPELLEWLSADFQRSGWHIKRLIRQLVTSTVYRQSSRRTESKRVAAESVDPENRLLWRMRLRRVDAEVVRDSLLAVGGTLDSTMGGPAIRSKTNSDGRVVEDEAGKRRRSIYLMVRRAYNLSLLSVFDQPIIGTTCSRRQPSAVVSQSLTMMNDAFLFEQAERFARQVRTKAGPSKDRQVEVAFRLALVRRPNNAERRWCLEHLERQAATFKQHDGDPEAAALVNLCHTILNTSEFLYAE